jgi:hypothetical protein
MREMKSKQTVREREKEKEIKKCFENAWRTRSDRDETNKPKKIVYNCKIDEVWKKFNLEWTQKQSLPAWYKRELNICLMNNKKLCMVDEQPNRKNKKKRYGWWTTYLNWFG